MTNFDWFGNIALSMDNKLGLESVRTNISNKSDFQIVHQFRNQISGIVVGSNTILIDNPSLRTREEYINAKSLSNPIPIIFDRRGRIELDARVITSIPTRPVLWITNSNRDDMPDNVIKIENTKLIDLKNKIETKLEQILDKNQDVDFSIMVEGGSQLMYNFIKEGIISRLRIFSASFSIENSDLLLNFPESKSYQLLSTKQIGYGIERIFSLQ